MMYPIFYRAGWRGAVDLVGLVLAMLLMSCVVGFIEWLRSLCGEDRRSI